MAPENIIDLLSDDEDLPLKQEQETNNFTTDSGLVMRQNTSPQTSSQPVRVEPPNGSYTRGSYSYPRARSDDNIHLLQVSPFNRSFSAPSFTNTEISHRDRHLGLIQKRNSEGVPGPANDPCAGTTPAKEEPRTIEGSTASAADNNSGGALPSVSQRVIIDLDNDDDEPPTLQSKRMFPSESSTPDNKPHGLSKPARAVMTALPSPTTPASKNLKRKPTDSPSEPRKRPESLTAIATAAHACGARRKARTPQVHQRTMLSLPLTASASTIISTPRSMPASSPHPYNTQTSTPRETPPASVAATPAKPRARPWTAAQLALLATQLQSAFDFDTFAADHGKTRQDVFDVFSVVVQMPLFEYSAKGMERAKRMKEFRGRVREYREQAKAAAEGGPGPGPLGVRRRRVRQGDDDGPVNHRSIILDGNAGANAVAAGQGSWDMGEEPRRERKKKGKGVLGGALEG